MTTARIPWVACCSLLLLAGCGARDPFSYVPASGKVTYEDGSLIPVDPLVLTFDPQSDPIDGKTYPRPGMAIVDPSNGTFNSATSHKVNDGLVRGRHKVTLGTVGRKPIAASIVPKEYGDRAKTPLEVDTTRQPFELKVRKPK